jgi:regulator of sirC expression with transglutaminase-like and TPR domain
LEPREAREELRRLLQEAPHPFPIDRAALLLAADVYPQLDLPSYEERLEAYAARVAEAAHGSAEPRRRLTALRRVLFEDEGFHGNRDHYYDVRNGYLNEVLDRKLGIPISLAAVVLGVARRLRWPMDGVSFPAHFLVRYDAPGEPLAIDPFHGGLILGSDELQERWRLSTGQDAPPPQTMLEPAPPALILIRMLNNIRMIHSQQREFRLAALAIEKMALVDPANPYHDRDLGYLYLADRDAARAARYLESYLERMPHAPDAAEVRADLNGLLP